MVRREIAVFALGVMGGCGSFGNDAPGTTGEETDAGSDGGKTTKPKDAAASDAGTEAASACTRVIDQPFSQAHVGWTPLVVGATPPAEAEGPDGMVGLRAQATLGPGQQAATVVDRVIDDLAPFTSGTAAFDFAYASLDPTATVGCMFATRRKVPLAEIRMGLALESSMTVLRFFVTEGGSVMPLELHQPITRPPPNAWTHVTFELRVAGDGFVEQAATIGGERTDLPRFQPPEALAGFNGVHLICGLLSATGTGGGSSEDVYMKDLEVSTCP